MLNYGQTTNRRLEMNSTILFTGTGALVVMGLISLAVDGPESLSSSFIAGGLTLMWIGASVLLAN